MNKAIKKRAARAFQNNAKRDEFMNAWWDLIRMKTKEEQQMG
jgi:hypothetical protein